MDKERKKKKNQRIVIEVQRLKEHNSQTIMKIKQKIIMSRKEQKDIKSENCMKSDKYVKTGVQCGYCQRWFHFKM